MKRSLEIGQQLAGVGNARSGGMGEAQEWYKWRQEGTGFSM